MPSQLSSEIHILPLTLWVSNSYDTYWRLINVSKQLLVKNRRRGFHRTASEVVQRITSGHRGSQDRYTLRIRCCYFLSALHYMYTMPPMIHVWRMVTENSVWRKIVKCCVWFLNLASDVWRPPDASQMQCWKTFRFKIMRQTLFSVTMCQTCSTSLAMYCQNLTVYRTKHKYPCTLLGPYDM